MTNQTDNLQPESNETELTAAPETGTETPSEMEATAAAEPEIQPAPRPPAKLERLQKILAKAGVASRRSAEALIEQGRVQVNGKVVTELGTKADAEHDHIRVDGKLLQGAERLRYFVLNKPKGFVTTVKDPEGRPTVMQFFDKMKERLYPVGRLDYMSEGLLVVTNDGELANRLTKAGSGVEKTYLVKVAGQPTEAELDQLRGGVAIERGQPGSSKVRTAPARIRQVRQGDNPWYEVILIEGRNRELRKMFEEVGHFVEKIRRVGYGPLVLDQEPGQLRELEPEELDALRKAAEGKLRTPKAKEMRRRNAADAAMLPTVRPKMSSRPRSPRPAGAKPFAKRFQERSGQKPPRQNRSQDRFSQDRPSRGRASQDQPGKNRFSKDRYTGERFSEDRPRKNFGRSAGPLGHDGFRASHFNRPADEEARPSYGRASASRPFRHRDREERRGGAMETGRGGGRRPFTAAPAGKKRERPERPPYKPQSAPQRPVRDRDFDEQPAPARPQKLQIEEITAERATRPSYGASRSGSPRPGRGAQRSYGAKSTGRAPSASAQRSFPRRDAGKGFSSSRPGKPDGFSRPKGKPEAKFKTGYRGKPAAGGGKRFAPRPGGKPRGRKY